MILPDIIVVLLGMCLSLLIVAFRLDLFHYDIHVPMLYAGDALTHCMYAKSVLDHGWYTTDPRMNMPTGFVLYDYPALETLLHLILLGLSPLLRDFGSLLNVYYLCTFPLTVLSAFITFRALSMGRGAAVTGGVLYSLLPYHFLRGIGHLGLASYFLVPLGLLLALRLLWPVSWHERKYGSPKRAWWRVASSASLLALLGLTSIYYVFFTGFFLAVAALAVWLRSRTVNSLRTTMLLPLGLLVVVLLNHVPVFLYQRSAGKNPYVARREPVQALRGSEGSLALSNLVVPPDSTGIGCLDRVITDNRSAHREERLTAGDYLGPVAAIGLGLLVMHLSVPARGIRGRQIRVVSFLTLAALVLSARGGLGYLLALAVTPKIRAYERIVPFVGFLAFCGYFLVLEGLLRGIRTTRVRRVVTAVALGTTFALGLVGQTQSSSLQVGLGGILHREETRAAFNADAAFVDSIERGMPEGAMVFQLPHVYWPEPETGSTSRMHGYDHIKGFLHSRTLRWSSPAMRQRSGDLWCAQTASKAVPQMLQSLVLMGFQGVWIDRWGYRDRGDALCREVQEQVETHPLRSNDRRLVFFPLTNYAQRLRASIADDSVWEGMRAAERLIVGLHPGAAAPLRSEREGMR